MSGSQPACSEQLRAGRRALDAIAGVDIVTDLTWHERTSVWLLQIRIHIQTCTDHGPVPAATNWWVQIDPNYPLGRIKLYPAKVGGINATFPHQAYNVEAPGDDPWRLGHICLDDPYGRPFGRNAPVPEPMDVHRRLHWHVLRAKEWVEAAAAGVLLKQGSRFELPVWPELIQGAATTVFSENASTFRAWNATSAQAGVADIAEFSDRYHAVMNWADLAGRPILDVPWGHSVSFNTRRRSVAWVRLSGPPILPPWQAPGTWGGLRRAAASSGTNLDALLEQVFPHLRKKDRSIVLVGFPIPERVGDPPSSVWWKPIEMPALSTVSASRRCSITPPRRRQRSQEIPRGYRNNALGRWMRYRLGALRDRDSINWLRSGNWSSDRIGARGRYVESMRKASVAVIGVGALGSIIADLLVRGGIGDMLLIDGDELAIGNLVRHRLSMDSLGENKASALAENLTLASPHVKVKVSPGALPVDLAELQDILGDRHVIVDCTGDDAPLDVLSRNEWACTKLFVSISVGWRARRLYFYAARGVRFPFSEYVERVRPWLMDDGRSFEAAEVPWEGAGCWHPSWPARLDDLMLLAAAASKLLEAEFATTTQPGKLQVFERAEGEGGVFNGIQRLET